MLSHLHASKLSARLDAPDLLAQSLQRRSRPPHRAIRAARSWSRTL